MKHAIADDGDVHTPYGATEALPVATIAASEVLNTTARQTAEGAGTCVGRKFSGIRWKVIRIHDKPIPTIDEIEELAPGEIGELIVQGRVITERYLTRVEANTLAKIDDPTGVWHRMGDVGYLDDDDRFWFCGRKAHRVVTDAGTMYTVRCEAIFNQHPVVYRSALVGVGQPPQQTPVLIVEPWPDRNPTDEAAAGRLLDELYQLGQQSELTHSIRREHLLIRDALPVDIRHNAKIFREKLTVWAEKTLA
jgi:acyl-CoA synthetase (AMP-forming)/AMP-acid ligase II